MKVIKNLIFGGAGVKGIAYVGALKALDERQIMKNIERVGGTSAGAITALLIGLGYSVAELDQILRNTKMNEFMDPAYLGTQYMKFPFQWGLHSGNGFETWVKEKIASRLENPEATFSDLRQKLLTQKANVGYMDKPNRFREMAFIGTNLSTRYAEIFSIDRTPQMKLAEAVRISMSYPFFFTPVKTEQGDYYIDGGLLVNYPIHLFDKDPSTPNLETLGFRSNTPEEVRLLSEKEKIFPSRYPISDITAYIKAFLATTLNQETNRHRESHDDIRTVYINTLNISAMDFSLSPEKMEALIEQGKNATELFLNHPRMIQDNPVYQQEQDKERLRRYDRDKMYQKSSSVFFTRNHTISKEQPGYIQWVFSPEKNTLTQRQKIKKYTEQLYGQPPLFKVAYAETTAFEADQKSYVVTAITDDKALIEEAETKQRKYHLQNQAHMVEARQLVSLGFWQRKDQLITYSDTRPKELFDVVGDAERKPDLKRLDELLAHRIRTDYQDDRGRTPLHQAVRYNHPEAVKLLLESNVDMNMTDHYGDTPLHKAARYGCLESMQIVLKYMPAINIANKYGNTPLHLCAATCEGKDQLACLQLLVNYQANLEVRNHIQLTPAEWAQKMLKQDAEPILGILNKNSTTIRNKL